MTGLVFWLGKPRTLLLRVTKRKKHLLFATKTPKKVKVTLPRRPRQLQTATGNVWVVRDKKESSQMLNIVAH